MIRNALKHCILLIPIFIIKTNDSIMSHGSEDSPENSAERVVRHNEKFNVPLQTEQEEAETFENAPVEDLADNTEIRRKKEGIE